MDSQDFRKYAHQLVDWMADYLENVEKYPVRSQVVPKQIFNQIPDNLPEQGQSLQEIFKDFQEIILPGITHWQSPNFYAYFPANSSYESLLAEMLTATLGAQCMIWETSPAATELEEKMMDWLKKAMHLPQHWEGVIQDTASTATLCAILSARERASDFTINHEGLKNNDYTIYCSNQTHSSIDKAVRIAGLGSNQLRKIATDNQYAIVTGELASTIEQDLAQGKKPLCVIANIGTTSSTAIDALPALVEICKKYNIWLHVDAAYAGSATLLEEYHWMIEGLEGADSYVFNPHKWLMVNFDCSAYFVKEKEWLIRTFEILPEYLKTKSDNQVNNYRDWGIALGRRFRALKLWFVLRGHGKQGLQKILRNHLQLAKDLASQIHGHPDFEILAPVPLNLICFRYHPNAVTDESLLDHLNEKLLHQLNKEGKIYLTHTRLSGKYTLRMVIGQTHVEQRHILEAWQEIQRVSKEVDRQ